MNEQDKDSGGEIPLSWFGKTLWKFTPLYAELVFLAICLRLIGLVEPFIFQVIIDRILPFQREASLIVVVAIFVAVGLFQLGFEARPRTWARGCSLPPTVMRDMPVSRAISRIDSFCRKCLRRMMFNSPMSITPLPRRSPLGEGSHRSNLNENSMPTPVSSG